MPSLLAGALLHHHRSRTGMTLDQASRLAHTSTRRISALETARVLPDTTEAGKLLRAYDAPAEDVTAGEALAAAALHQAATGHRHRADASLLQHSVWVPALTAAARETTILSGGPLRPVIRAARTSAGRYAKGRRVRVTLLLHEPVLHQASAEDLTSLARLVDQRALTVHLVPPRAPVPPGLLAEWTLTTDAWDGSAAERRNRQLYVVCDAAGHPSLMTNGPEAASPRTILRAATDGALGALKSSLLLVGAAQDAHRKGRTDERRSA